MDFFQKSDCDLEYLETLLLGKESEEESEPNAIPFELSELQEVPYYKRPLVQLLSVIAVGLPIIWLILAAFSGGNQPTVAKKSISESEREKAKLILLLNQERQKNHQLALQNALAQQTLNVTHVKPIASTKPAPPPVPQPLKIAQAAPQLQVARTAPPSVAPKPMIAKASVRPAPQPQAQAQAIPQPKQDPMAQWLALADRGHYTTALVTDNKPGATLAAHNTPVRAQSNSNSPSLPEDRQIRARLERTPLLNESELLDRLSGSTRPKVTSTLKQPQPIASAKSAKIIDIGSSAKATLESAVVWTNRGPSQPNKKYLLRLDEEFKNIDGQAILPEDTRLIAQVKEFSNSGLLFMEVTQILYDGDKIAVPPGALLIEGKKGSPLKADLKQKGDSDFWANAGSVVTPGVERAFESVGDTLVIADGERSLLRTNNSGIQPLANGASGIADGLSQTLNRRLERNQSETILSYFQLDSGKTVYLKAYEDISLN